MEDFGYNPSVKVLASGSARSAGDSLCQARVEMIDPLQHSRYDEWVGTWQESLPFHSAAWLRVIHDAYGHRPVCFVVKRGRDILAMLPIVEVQSWVAGRRGVIVPFADICPPMAKDATAFQVALAEGVRYARERKWKYLELRGGANLMRGAQPSVLFRAHALDLSIGPDKLFEGFDSPTRGKIRKAERAGVRTEVCTSLEALRVYYCLHCETRKKHGAPPQPFSFFQSLFRHYVSKDSGIIVIAWSQSVPIAAAVFLHRGGQAVYKYSASREAFRTVPGNNLVMWESIRWHANRGFSRLHFGRTSIGNEGLRKYKSGWGTEESTLEYFKYSCSENAYIRCEDKSEGAYQRLFRMLPTPLFRWAGSLLYPHLS